jgi:hypothetical protein
MQRKTAGSTAVRITAIGTSALVGSVERSVDDCAGGVTSILEQGTDRLLQP